MFDGDFGYDGYGSEPPGSFWHLFWFVVIGIVLIVAVRSLWF